MTRAFRASGSDRTPSTTPPHLSLLTTLVVAAVLVAAAVIGAVVEEGSDAPWGPHPPQVAATPSRTSHVHLWPGANTLR